MKEEINEDDVKCMFFFRKAMRKDEEEDNQNELRNIVENAKGRIENIVKEMGLNENDNRGKNVELKKKLKNLSNFISETRNKEQ